MKKLILFLVVLAAVCAPVHAQIGQIQNPVTGQLYAQDSGTCSTPNSFVTQQLPNSSLSTTVNLSGTFSATVTIRESNNGGASWVTAGTSSAAGTTSYSTNGFSHVCVDVTSYSSGTVLVSISTGVAISGVPGTPYTHGGGAPTGSCVSGTFYLNDSNGSLYTCNAGLWGFPGSPPPNTTGIPATNGPSTFYAANYGVKADTYVVYDAVCSNGSNIVTSATAHFLTVAKIKVGQTIWAIPGAGIGGSVPSIPKTTILSIDSDTQIHTVANGIAGCTTGNALIWGDDDTAALNVAWAAATAGINCGSLYLPSGMMMVSAGVMNTPLPATCGAANLFNNAVTIVGAGWQNTTLAPTPDFDLTTCSGSGRVACFNANAVSIFNLQINGYGLLQTAVAGTTANLVSVFSPANLVNFSCQDFATSDTNVTGINVTNFIFWLTDLQAATCGGISVNFSTAAAGSAIIGSYIVPGNGASPTVASNSPGADFYSTWWGISGVVECAVNFTGYAHEFGEPAQPGAEICVNGGHLTLSGGIVSHNQGIANRAALKITNSGVAQASNESFIDAGAGEFSVSVDATSTFIDGCGNTFTGPINVAAGGKFIPCAGQVYPASSVLQLAAITGTGACATSSTVLGNIFTGSAACTGTTGASTFIVTPSTTAVNGWNCQGTYDKTTYAVPTAMTYTTTACTVTFTSVTANDVIAFKVSPF